MGELYIRKAASLSATRNFKENFRRRSRQVLYLNKQGNRLSVERSVGFRYFSIVYPIHQLTSTLLFDKSHQHASPSQLANLQTCYVSRKNRKNGMKPPLRHA